MDEKDSLRPEENGQEEEFDTRPAWQRMKEGWYDKVPLSVRQLDIIIALGLIGLAVMAVVIFLDAGGYF